MKLRVLILACSLIVTARGAAAAGSGPIAFVPLDDRPVTYQLPVLLGRIAGVDVVTPPRRTLGHYLRAGDPEAIAAWLRSSATQDAQAVVLSTDMIAYGGLVNSRILGDVPAFAAISRLRDAAALRPARPGAWFGAFGTVMRLAPTGVPQSGPGSQWFAPGRAGEALTEWANLPQGSSDPEVRRKNAALRAIAGEDVIAAYLATRARNLEVDLYLLQLAAEDGFDRVVLGQDDAGAAGLHVADVARLRGAAARFGLGARASIEPGADELGMALVANALARSVHWTPKVAVHYARADGALLRDPLEFEPASATIGSLIALCGGRDVQSGADIEVFVRSPETSDADEAAFHHAIADAVAAGKSVAVIDLSFLHEKSDEPARTAHALIAQGIAAKIDAFASWNTTANTAGTALAEAIAVGAGKRAGTYSEIAHARFMLDRYADDYAFHIFVRPDLNARLQAAGVEDHTYLAGPALASAQTANRSALWRQTLALLAQIYPQYRDAGLLITLPWNRTFETQLDVRLRPAD